MERRTPKSGRRGTDQIGAAADEGRAAYAIFRNSTRVRLEKLSLHVFARAYRSAWCALYLHDPVGEHQILSLDLLIAFPQTAARSGRASTRQTPRSQ